MSDRRGHDCERVKLLRPPFFRFFSLLQIVDTHGCTHSRDNINIFFMVWLLIFIFMTPPSIFFLVSYLIPSSLALFFILWWYQAYLPTLIMMRFMIPYAWSSFHLYFIRLWIFFWSASSIASFHPPALIFWVVSDLATILGRFWDHLFYTRHQRNQLN